MTKSQALEEARRRYLATCLTCYSGARLETNSKREAECHATSHMNTYGHEVTVIDRNADRREKGKG